MIINGKNVILCVNEIGDIIDDNKCLTCYTDYLLFEDTSNKINYINVLIIVWYVMKKEQL